MKKAQLSQFKENVGGPVYVSVSLMCWYIVRDLHLKSYTGFDNEDIEAPVSPLVTVAMPVHSPYEVYNDNRGRHHLKLFQK